MTSNGNIRVRKWLLNVWQDCLNPHPYVLWWFWDLPSVSWLVRKEDRFPVRYRPLRNENKESDQNCDWAYCINLKKLTSTQLRPGASPGSSTCTLPGLCLHNPGIALLLASEAGPAPQKLSPHYFHGTPDIGIKHSPWGEEIQSWLFSGRGAPISSEKNGWITETILPSISWSRWTIQYPIAPGKLWKNSDAIRFNEPRRHPIY
jgi:hypothetical protein